MATYYFFVGNLQEIDDFSDGGVEIVIPEGSMGILIQALDQNIRIRFDGQPAEADSGFRLIADSPERFLPMRAGQSISIMEETAGATVNIQPVRIWE